MAKDWFAQNAPDTSSSADWFSQNAPPDAAQKVTNVRVGRGGKQSVIDNRNENNPTVNPWGWMAPAGMMVGGALGGVPGAMLGGGAGTILDQNINAMQHSPWAPQSALQGDLGIAGNAALGGASEFLPPKVMGALGKAIGPALYKGALHVSPEMAQSFPKVNIPNEAWAQGAPELSLASGPANEAVIAERAARMRKLFEIAQARRVPGHVWADQPMQVPTMFQRDMTFDLPMTDPQAGALPTVPRRVQQPGVQPVSVAQNRMPSQAQEVGGPNQNVWTEYRPAPPVEAQVPRTVVPNPPQQVTHTVNVPGTTTVTGMAKKPALLPMLRSNPTEMFDQSPGLKKLMADVGNNLEGARDEGEVEGILNAWLKKNQNVTSLNDLYSLGQRAGSAGDWVPPSNVGGRAAQEATSPNAKLTGKQLRLSIVSYIDQQMQKAGVGGFREALGNTQRSIAVKEAVHDAAMRSTPHLNASGMTEKVGIANRLLPPRQIGNMGAFMGGMRPTPTNSPFGNFVLQQLPQAAGWGAVNAARLAPWLFQQPNAQGGR